MLAVVGDQSLPIAQAQTRLAAKLGKAPHQAGRGHRDHLHRQGKSAQGLHLLAFVGNAHKTLGHGSDNFFARERRTTAFDHEAVAVNFIRPVDVHRQAFNGLGVQHPNAHGLQALGRGF